MFALTDRGFACPDSDILTLSGSQNRTFYPLVAERSESLFSKDLSESIACKIEHFTLFAKYLNQYSEEFTNSFLHSLHVITFI